MGPVAEVAIGALIRRLLGCSSRAPKGLMLMTQRSWVVVGNADVAEHAGHGLGMPLGARRWPTNNTAQLRTP